MQPQTSSLVFLQYLTTVFENITEVILLIGIEPRGKFRLLLANQAFYESSGHKPDVLGKEVQDIVAPATYSVLVKQYQRTIKSKKPVEYTNWSTTPKGRRAYHVKMIPIFNTVGDCVQLAAIVEDITEIAKIQEEVRQLRIATGTAKDK